LFPGPAVASEADHSRGKGSRLEGRSDIYVSTLHGYIEPLGGHLEVAAVFDDQRLTVNVGPIE
jgi:hypothetical protein